MGAGSKMGVTYIQRVNAKGGVAAVHASFGATARCCVRFRFGAPWATL
jgi:hypothetical protein